MEVPQKVNPWEELFLLIKSNYNSHEQFRMVCLMGFLSLSMLVFLTGAILMCAYKRRDRKKTEINIQTAIKIIENLEENSMFLEEVVQILMQSKTTANLSGDGVENTIKEKQQSEVDKQRKETNGATRRRTVI